jgi:hypothetical protein
MSNDHFIARTYLKHFGDPKARGMLHAYRKTDGKEFPCWPKDVCHEWEGDLNDAFPDNPGMLGDYRKIFEPLWNPAVKTILEGSIGREEKFIVSAYMANLMVCTPAWRRVGQKIYRDGHVGVLKFKQEMAEKHGKPDPILKEGLEALDQGHIEIEVDPGYIKAKAIRRLMDFACTIYDQDWTIVANTTDQPFVTSDNPVAISYSGKPGDPMTRFLPITPRLCLSVRMPLRPGERRTSDDVRAVMSAPPRGKIFHAEARPLGARETNKLIVQCAEELVFSSTDDDGVRELAKKYSRFRVDTDTLEVRRKSEPNAVYHGFVVQIKEIP